MEDIVILGDNLKKIIEGIEKSADSRAFFIKKHDEIVKKNEGRIVAVIAGNIASVPFTDDVAEAQKNFKVLESKIGKENMSSARISYIPGPNETLML